MIRFAAILALAALPAPVLGQATAPDVSAQSPTTLVPGPVVREQDAPFAVAGDLASRLDAQTILTSDYFTLVPMSEIDAPLLDRARVIDIAGNRISGVEGILTDVTGTRISGVVLGVGGVAGIGRKQVQVPLEATLVGVSDELGETRMIVALTEGELADLPAFEDPAAE